MNIEEKIHEVEEEIKKDLPLLEILLVFVLVIFVVHMHTKKIIEKRKGDIEKHLVEWLGEL
ncbi:MAG: hypothetical protein KAJ18_09910 [Candidatus Omnitrophica bacterium]|nr:hypothetical protein [Candidatus Omnitrophota bacterium]